MVNGSASAPRRARILFLEDEMTIREVLTEYMTVAGYEVEAIERGDEALARLRAPGAAQRYDLAVLDIMVPGASGLDVLAEIERLELPMGVVMLTALDDETTELIAFNHRADDYIVKPVSPLILLKRIETILRRVGRQAEMAGSAVPLAREGTQARLVLYHDAWQARFDGEPLALTVSEFLLLATLMGQPQRVFNREQLILAIYDDHYAGNDRIIDSHVKNLRKKLPLPYVRTVIGVGYQFDAEAEASECS